jgi:hypothetical protein
MHDEVLEVPARLGVVEQLAEACPATEDRLGDVCMLGQHGELPIDAALAVGDHTREAQVPPALADAVHACLLEDSPDAGRKAVALVGRRARDVETVAL